MPFHNPFWAKKANIKYQSLGMYPITAKATGSQTEVGSSKNTIEVEFAHFDAEFWSNEFTIPAYTYFTLGDNILDASNVPAVSDPDTPILPYNVQSVSGSNQKMEWQATFASYSASKTYDGSALTNSGLVVTDIYAEDKDTVWYSGANPVHLAFSIQKNEGTLTVTAAPTPNLKLRTASAYSLADGDDINISLAYEGGVAPYKIYINDTLQDTVSEPRKSAGGDWYVWSKTVAHSESEYVCKIEDATGATASKTATYTYSD